MQRRGAAADARPRARTPRCAANSPSKASIRGPIVSQPERSVSATASTCASLEADVEDGNALVVVRGGHRPRLIQPGRGETLPAPRDAASPYCELDERQGSKALSRGSDRDGRGASSSACSPPPTRSTCPATGGDARLRRGAASTRPAGGPLPARAPPRRRRHPGAGASNRRRRERRSREARSRSARSSTPRTANAPATCTRVLAYDTRTRKWSEPTSSPIGLNHSQAATYDGNALSRRRLPRRVRSDRRQFWRYDPATDRVDRAAADGTGPRRRRGGGDRRQALRRRRRSADLLGVNGRGQAPTARLEVFDFKTGNGKPAPTCRSPATTRWASPWAASSTSPAGGRTCSTSTTTSPPSPSSTATTRRTDTLGTAARRCPFGVGFEGITAAAGKVVIVGGEDQADWEDGGGWADASAWDFDPKTERWQRLPDLHDRAARLRRRHARGRIYALMGSYCPGLPRAGPRERTRSSRFPCPPYFFHNPRARAQDLHRGSGCAHRGLRRRSARLRGAHQPPG